MIALILLSILFFLVIKYEGRDFKGRFISGNRYQKKPIKVIYYTDLHK